MSLLERIGREIRLTLEAAIPALIFVFIVFTFGVESYEIPSQSMEPTLEVGDRILVTKYSYGYSRWNIPYGLGSILPAAKGRLFGRAPKRGDVVVLRHPFQKIDLIKRVMGVPGDVIEVAHGRVIINGKMLPRELIGNRNMMRYQKGEPYGYPAAVMEYRETLPDGSTHAIFESGDEQDLDNFGPVTVPAGTVFLMGDSRDNSLDSRAPNGPGMAPFDRLEGKAQTVLFSLYRCRGKEDGLDCADSRWLKPFRIPARPAR